MIKILVVCASPVAGSSTEVILRRIAASIETGAGEKTEVQTAFVNLNELQAIPCQACGKDPAPDYCLFEDDLTPVYRLLAECDCVLFGSPVYFDSVSAQAKLFIDRCNCLRPPDYANIDPEHAFIKRLDRKRPGAMVLVGGERGWFEGARRVIAGFFKWVEVTNEGTVVYKTPDFRRSGAASEDEAILAEADRLGSELAAKIQG